MTARSHAGRRQHCDTEIPGDIIDRTVDIMIEITYFELLIFITIAWIIYRIIAGIKAGKVSPAEEAKMLMVYICIIVIARIVDFPWHHVNGKIDTMKFDSSKLIPFRINAVPFVNLLEVYDGWRLNIIGNITMFIPVGIVWPICFKKLDTAGKTILAGAGFSLFIEITQLLLYERCSDIDDLILNTTGVAIGALICFGCRKLSSMKRSR